MLIIYFTKLILEPAILHAYTLRRTPPKFPRCVAGQRSPITDRNIVQFTRASLLKTLCLFFSSLFFLTEVVQSVPTRAALFTG